MAELLNISEPEYRQLDLDSYSSIKVFLDDRKKYYRKCVLKEKVEENKSQESDDMRFGNLVDCLLLTPDEFDIRYSITTAVKPSGQMEEFVNILTKLTFNSVSENGDLTRKMTELIQEAYDILAKANKGGKLRDSLEKFQERFLIKKEGYDYYMELRSRGNQTIVTPEEVEMANRVVEFIVMHPHTYELMNMQSTENFEVKNQLIVTGEYENIKLKMMTDKLIIDHKQKIVTPFDLKVMGNIDIFPYNYLKLRYYIQLAVYTTLLRQYYLPLGYSVQPLRFLTVDKFRYMDPVIVKTNEADYLNAVNGFTLFDKKYRGLKEALSDIRFHKNKGIWTSSREAQENSGVVTLKLHENYEGE